MCIRVKSCCFCNDLAKGSRVIAILGLVFGCLVVVASFAELRYSNIAGGLLEIGACACLLHGVQTKKTAFIMVWMVLYMIQIVCSVGLALVVVSAIPYLDTHFGEVLEALKSYGYPELENVEDKEEVRSLAITIAWVIFALILLITGIYIYFWSVVYSLYKKIQTELTTGETNQVPLKADYGYEGVFNKA